MKLQKKKILAAFLVSCLFLAAFLPLKVKGAKESTQTIRVGYIGHTGFIQKNSRGYYEGYGVAYLNKISQYTGWKYEYEFINWQDAQDSLEEGRIDLLCTAQKTKAREERFLFSQKSLGTEDTIVYAAEDAQDIFYQDYDKMDGATVAVLAGGFQNEEFRRHAEEEGFSYTEKEYRTDDEVKQALESGEADLAVLGSLSRHDDMKIVDKLERQPFYFITSKNKQWLMDTMDAAMKELHSVSPYLESQLYEEYYGNGVMAADPLLTREEAEYIKNADTLDVVFRNDSYPLVYWNEEEEKIEGILAELLRTISEKSGLKMDMRLETEGKSVEELFAEDSRILEVGDLCSQELMENPQIQFTDVFFSQPSILVSGKDRNIYEMREPVLAVPALYKTAESLLPEWAGKCRQEYKDSMKECLDAVAGGEADATIQDMQTLNYYIQMRRYRELNITAIQAMKEDYSILLSVDADRELVSILDKSISCIDTNMVNEAVALYTIARPYDFRMKDMIYDYREYIIMSIVIVVLLILSAMAFSRRHTRILVERREKEAYRIKAETDELTGLLNRKTFYQKAEAMMNKDPEKAYQILFLNIENFKIINDLFGVEEGDNLLTAMGKLVQNNADINKGVCARFEADHFLICMGQGNESVEYITKNISQGMAQYPLSLMIEISCGVYQAEPGHRKEIAIMCDRAHLAADSIKGSHMDSVAYYNDFHRQKMIQKQLILNEMSTALAQKQFKVYLQPKYDVIEEKMIGAEALVRWEHPLRGIISPGDFIPVFEHNGFIAQLDEYMFVEVCSLMQKWKEEGKELVPVSVNLSRMSFFNPKLCQMLCQIVEKYQLENEMLELEVTETSYATDMELMNSTLRRLQEEGFRILMDDFGSGYSSLNMLKEAPLDEIKLDMRFLSEEDPYDRASKILEMVIAMGNSLSISVLAEGVETGQQVEMLKNFQCRKAQGYFYARPEPAENFEKRLGTIL